MLDNEEDAILRMRSLWRKSFFFGMYLLIATASNLAAVAQEELESEQPSSTRIPDIFSPLSEEPSLIEGPILFPKYSGARLEPDGSITIIFPVYDVNFIGDAHAVFAPDDPNYVKVRESLGELPVGKWVEVPAHLIEATEN